MFDQVVCQLVLDGKVQPNELIELSVSDKLSSPAKGNQSDSQVQSNMHYVGVCFSVKSLIQIARFSEIMTR